MLLMTAEANLQPIAVTLPQLIILWDVLKQPAICFEQLHNVKSKANTLNSMLSLYKQSGKYNQHKKSWQRWLFAYVVEKAKAKL